MPIVAEQIELRTNCEATTLKLSNVEKYGDGSGYGCQLSVRSGGFSVERHFYFDHFHLAKAIDAIRSMTVGAPGEATIRGQWDEDEINFNMNVLGHVIVSGQIFEHAELSQALKFAFRTDQTVLGPLLRDLEAIHVA
jgi:hypothetical protein